MQNNIPQHIQDKISKKLHNIKNHPIEILKTKVFNYFKTDIGYYMYDTLSPFVKIEDNFDNLLIPENHPSRSPKDTFYFDEKFVLRTHTSAHQIQLMKVSDKFLVAGDVYRNDTIDKTHYPIFHQIEGVELFQDKTREEAEIILKEKLSKLIEYLFPNIEYRINSDYFPFTEPSFEFEILWNNQWLEVLGCGVIHENIMKNKVGYSSGIAFGLGIERLAMILFDIPDIRYFWEEDERFLKQFESGEIIKFQPYSKFPVCYKDLSMWINNIYSISKVEEIAKEIAGDLFNEIKIIDTFQKNNRESITLRFFYQSFERNLTNDEINQIHFKIVERIRQNLKVEIR